MSAADCVLDRAHLRAPPHEIKQAIFTPHDKTKIASAAGDPAGVGPEVSLKAALDPDP